MVNCVKCYRKIHQHCCRITMFITILFQLSTKFKRAYWVDFPFQCPHDFSLLSQKWFNCFCVSFSNNFETEFKMLTLSMIFLCHTVSRFENRRDKNKFQLICKDPITYTRVVCQYLFWTLVNPKGVLLNHSCLWSFCWSIHLLVCL